MTEEAPKNPMNLIPLRDKSMTKFEAEIEEIYKTGGIEKLLDLFPTETEKLALENLETNQPDLQALTDFESTLSDRKKCALHKLMTIKGVHIAGWHEVFGPKEEAQE